MNWLNNCVDKGDGNGRIGAVGDNNNSAKEIVDY